MFNLITPYPQDKVTGNLQVNTSSGFAHSGILLEIQGQVSLQLSAKSVGLFEAFYNSIKPVDLIDYKFPIQDTGKIGTVSSHLKLLTLFQPTANQTFPLSLTSNHLQDKNCLKPTMVFM